MANPVTPIFSREQFKRLYTHLHPPRTHENIYATRARDNIAYERAGALRISHIWGINSLPLILSRYCLISLLVMRPFNKLTSVFSCVCPVIDHEKNIVKVAVDPQTTLAML